MLQYILNTKLIINGRKISCKVTGKPNSAKDGQPFVLYIPGGPGFGAIGIVPTIRKLLEQATKKGKPHCHFILFDPLGCGESDKALNPDNEYTFDNYAEMAALVVEGVKNKLQIPKMDLSIRGDSFGGLVAMKVPVHRPFWVKSDAVIRLRTININATPNKLNDNNAALRYVEEHYKSHRNYPAIKRAVQKFLSGNITSQEDYLKNFIFPVGVLYGDKNEAVLNSFFGRLIQKYPMPIIRTLKTINSLYPFDSIKYLLANLIGCHYELLNHFYQKNDGKLDLCQIVKENESIFREIAICCFVGDRDYLANGSSNAVKLQSMLPQNIGLIVLNSKHAIGLECPDLFRNFTLSILMEGKIHEADLKNGQNSKQISNYILPQKFIERLSRFNSSSKLSLSSQGDTTTTFLSNWRQGNSQESTPLLSDPDEFFEEDLNDDHDPGVSPSKSTTSTDKPVYTTFKRK